VGHRRGERKARGGAPLMRGPHKTCASSNTWQRVIGGVSLMRRAPHTQRKGTWGPQNAEVELREGRTSLMRGPHKVLSQMIKV
jgi:hypothetical protein